MFKNYANKNTPTTNKYWRNLSDNKRVNTINEVKTKTNRFNSITITRAYKNGQVFVTLIEVINAASRGTILLDFEEYIKNKVDLGLNLWCEPISDKSSLRNLRGIEIKT